MRIKDDERTKRVGKVSGVYFTAEDLDILALLMARWGLDRTSVLRMAIRMLAAAGKRLEREIAVEAVEAVRA